MANPERLDDYGLPNNINMTLAFQSNDGSYSIGVRTSAVGHSWEVVATESHARENRAMYPRQRAVGRFFITLLLKGYKEQEAVMNFFRSYVYAWQFGNKPTMMVTSMTRGLIRRGVPIKGMAIEDHVGSLLFTPTITFESAQDPQDPTILTPAQASTTDLGGGESDAKNFFYPFSRGSQDITVRPETYYDFGDNENTGIGGALNNIFGGIGADLGNNIDSVLDGFSRADGR
jgi:hypothetical protein